MSQWLKEKETVLAAARQMAAKGLTVGTAGNVSLRLPSRTGRELLAITPSSRYYDEITAADIQIIDFKAQPVEGTLPPSIEANLHIGIYRARPDVNAVMHTHSVYASAVAVAGREIPPILDDQVAFLGGGIKLAGHAPTGSRAQVENVLAALGERSAVLLPNHGAVATGRTLRDAFTAGELIEKTARIYLLALEAGNVNPLPPDSLSELKSVYRKLQDTGEQKAP
jgi:ribulose-5-phosphate 4-epimerase/fuculose-1-phosphate aldolase